MEKYRLIRLNEVKYTDSEEVRDALIENGFVLEPLEEEGKSTTKSGKK